MRKYKLTINFNIGTIKLKKGNLISESEDGLILCKMIKENPDIFQELKPINYTEDFKDGSFPEKDCNNCKFLQRACIKDCKPSFSVVTGCKQWQGSLKGQPIYEGDKCWLVFTDQYETNDPEIHYDTWDKIKNPRPSVKYFSNEQNAKIYFKELQTENKIIELRKWINNEEVFKWFSDGNTTFEFYAEKLINKGLDIEFIKMMLSGLYHAVSGELEN